MLLLINQKSGTLYDEPYVWGVKYLILFSEKQVSGSKYGKNVVTLLKIFKLIWVE
jgi:hypothetical protein